MTFDPIVPQPVVTTYLGRAVELRVIKYRDLLTCSAVAESTGDANDGGHYMLVLSAHWQDTGERVFADLDALKDSPAPFANEITRLLGAASQLNAPSIAPKANGKDLEAGRPSL